MRKIITVAFCCLTLFTYQALAQKTNTASRASTANKAGVQSLDDKIEGFLKATTPYTRYREGVWTVDYEGESLGKFKLLVLTGEKELLIMAVVLAKKDNVKLNQDLLYKLLEYNANADYVKIAIDREGDFVARTDLNGKLTGLQQFKEVMQQITAAANQIHAIMSGSLITPAK